MIIDNVGAADSYDLRSPNPGIPDDSHTFESLTDCSRANPQVPIEGRPKRAACWLIFVEPSKFRDEIKLTAIIAARIHTAKKNCGGLGRTESSATERKIWVGLFTAQSTRLQQETKSLEQTSGRARVSLPEKRGTDSRS